MIARRCGAERYALYVCRTAEPRPVWTCVFSSPDHRAVEQLAARMEGVPTRVVAVAAGREPRAVIA